MKNVVDIDWKSKTLTLIVMDRDFSFNMDGKTDMEQLAIFAQAMEYANAIGEDQFLSQLEDWAADTAEEAELPFSYSHNGKTRTYTPASMWEASGSCTEWEQSAQYGYDYGWDI